MSVTHTFVSAKPAASDPTQVGSTEWNAAHTVTFGTGSGEIAEGDHTHAYGDISGTGIVGQVAEFVTDTKTLQAAKLIAPAVNILTLTNAAASTLALNITAAKTLTLTATDDYTLTVPATGTAALLQAANVFTAEQTIQTGTTYATVFSTTEVSGTYGYLESVIKPSGTNASFPAHMLVVASYNNTQANRYAGALFKLGTVNEGSIIADATSIIFRKDNGGSLYFQDGTTNRMTIVLGNVGIGINSALAKLHVVGTADDEVAIFKANATQTANLTEWQNSAGTVLSSIGADGLLSVFRPTTTTNAILEVSHLEARVSTTATGGANGFGVGQTFYAETATDGTNQLQAQIASVWVDATNATRKAKLQLSAYDTAIRTGLEIEATGSDVTLRTLGKVSFTQTDDNEYIDSLADGYMDYRATTAHRFGDGTNYLQIDADGDLSLVGTAIYERHVQLDAKADGTVANQPTPIDFFTAGGLQFASVGAKYAFCQWEIPDDWDGTDAYIEIDWFPDSGAISGTDAIRWTVEYRSIAEGEAINLGTSVTVDNGVGGDTTDYAQYETKHTRFTLDFDNANQPLTAQDHMYFKISRDTSVANDFAGTVTVSAYEIIYNSKGFPTSN